LLNRSPPTSAVKKLGNEVFLGIAYVLGNDGVEIASHLPEALHSELVIGADDVGAPTAKPLPVACGNSEKLCDDHDGQRECEGINNVHDFPVLHAIDQAHREGQDARLEGRHSLLRKGLYHQGTQVPMSGRIQAQHTGPQDFIDAAAGFQRPFGREGIGIEQHLLHLCVTEHHPRAALLVVAHAANIELLPLPRIDVRIQQGCDLLLAARDQARLRGGGQRHVRTSWALQSQIIFRKGRPWLADQLRLVRQRHRMGAELLGRTCTAPL
jgi:hypothetical protein